MTANAIPQPVRQLIEAVRAQKTVTYMRFLEFCRDAMLVVKQYPACRQRIAYEIVRQGRRFADFSATDPVPLRRKITELAASLEVPDAHVYTGNGLSVQQQWELLEMLISTGLSTVATVSITTKMMHRLLNTSTCTPQLRRLLATYLLNQVESCAESLGEEATIINEIAYLLDTRYAFSLAPADKPFLRVLHFAGLCSVPGGPSGKAAWQELERRIRKAAEQD